VRDHTRASVGSGTREDAVSQWVRARKKKEQRQARERAGAHATAHFSSRWPPLSHTRPGTLFSGRESQV